MLRFLRGFFLGHDVDLAVGQLAGETHVLPAATDGQRKLIIRHDNFDAALVLIQHDARNGGRLKGVDHERGGVFRPRDDIDLLALQFLHHGLHAAALHADAGADRVNAGIVGDHADLGAAAGIAGGGLDLDDAIVDLGHFLREQLAHEIGVCAGKENLRTAVVALHLGDQCAHTLAHAGGFARDLLVAADHTLGTAEVDDHVAELDRLDDAGNDFARAVLEFLELALTLCIAHLLEDHLLRALCVDAAKIVHGGQRVDDEVAHGRARLKLLGLFQIDLLEVVFHFLDHFDDAPQAQVAGHRVKLGPNIVLLAEACACGLLDRLFHRFDHDALVDHLLRRDSVGDRKQFSLVGGNGTGHQLLASSSCSSSSISSTPLISSGLVAAISLSVKTSWAE